MMIEVLKSKIHCARVTEANLNYMGSITIDEDLLDAANTVSYTHLDVYKRQGITTLYDGFPSFMFDKVQLDFI